MIFSELLISFCPWIIKTPLEPNIFISSEGIYPLNQTHSFFFFLFSPQHHTANPLFNSTHCRDIGWNKYLISSPCLTITGSPWKVYYPIQDLSANKNYTKPDKRITFIMFVHSLFAAPTEMNLCKGPSKIFLFLFLHGKISWNYGELKWGWFLFFFF